MKVRCFIVESIIRLGNIEVLFLNGSPSFRIDQKALCIVTRTVKMISRNEWSLFCVTFYYFEDSGNIPIHSYITKSWQETIASIPPVAKFCFPQTNVETQEALFPTVLLSDQILLLWFWQEWQRIENLFQI